MRTQRRGTTPYPCSPYVIRSVGGETWSTVAVPGASGLSVVLASVAATRTHVVAVSGGEGEGVVVGDEAGWRQIERRGEVPLNRVITFGEGFLALSTDGDKVSLWRSVDGEAWTAVPGVPQPPDVNIIRAAGPHGRGRAGRHRRMGRTSSARRPGSGASRSSGFPSSPSRPGAVCVAAATRVPATVGRADSRRGHAPGVLRGGPDGARSGWRRLYRGERHGLRFRGLPVDRQRNAAAGVADQARRVELRRTQWPTRPGGGERRLRARGLHDRGAVGRGPRLCLRPVGQGPPRAASASCRRLPGSSRESWVTGSSWLPMRAPTRSLYPGAYWLLSIAPDGTVRTGARYEYRHGRGRLAGRDRSRGDRLPVRRRGDHGVRPRWHPGRLACPGRGHTVRPWFGPDGRIHLTASADGPDAPAARLRPRWANRAARVR